MMTSTFLTKSLSAACIALLTLFSSAVMAATFEGSGKVTSINIVTGELVINRHDYYQFTPLTKVIIEPGDTKDYRAIHPGAVVSFNGHIDSKGQPVLQLIEFVAH